MASTLYIQIPSKTVADTTENCFAQAFSFCLVSTEKNILQQGKQSLSELKSLAQSAQQVVLLLAASDVNYMSVAVPPLPFTKLMAVLPNMLEDQVLADPSQLLFVCKPPKNAQALVAIVSRTWMETLLAQAQILQARKLSAFAISTTMLVSSEENSASIILEMNASNSDEQTSPLLELSIRPSQEQSAALASGMSLQAEQFFKETRFNAAEFIQHIQILSPQKKYHIYADASITAELESAAIAQSESTDLNEMSFDVHPLGWKEKIGGVDNSNIDLFSSLVKEGSTSFDWPRWRWSLMLGAAILIVCMLGLNWKWWKLHQESSALRASLISSYKNSFPKERVLRDPMEQMQQKIEQSKKAAGQSTKEDFIVIASQFSQAWDALMGGASVNYIEYKERSLYIKPAAGTNPDIEQLRTMLKTHSLKLEVSDGIYKVSADRGDGR